MILDQPNNYLSHYHRSAMHGCLQQWARQGAFASLKAASQKKTCGQAKRMDQSRVGQLMMVVYWLPMALSKTCRDAGTPGRHQDRHRETPVETLGQSRCCTKWDRRPDEQLTHYSQTGTTFPHCWSRDNRQPSIQYPAPHAFLRTIWRRANTVSTKDNKIKLKHK